MRITTEEMIAAMSGVSEQLIMESMAGSRTIKERFLTRISTMAASLALVVVLGVVALTAARGGGNVTPGTQPGEPSETAPEAETRITTVMIDETEVRLTWKVTGDGVITDIDVSSSGDHTVALADTQGKYYGSMMLHVDERFYVICDLYTGEINDFMREVSYESIFESAIKSWDIIKDWDGIEVHYWRYDRSGVYFIAVTFNSADMGILRELRALWAFNYNTSELTAASLIDTIPSDDESANMSVYRGAYIWFVPKNGSWSSSSGDGGMYFVTATFVHDYGYADMDGMREWFRDIGTDETYRVRSAPDNPTGTAEIEFDYGGRHYVHHLHLSTGKLTFISDGTQTENPSIDEPKEHTTKVRIDGLDIGIRWWDVPEEYWGGGCYEKIETYNSWEWDFYSSADGRPGYKMVTVQIGRDFYIVDLETGEVYADVTTLLDYIGIPDAYMGGWDIDAAKDFSRFLIHTTSQVRGQIKGDDYAEFIVETEVYYVEQLEGDERFVMPVTSLPEIKSFKKEHELEYPLMTLDADFRDDGRRVLITVTCYDSPDAYMINDPGLRATFVYDPGTGSVTPEDYTEFPKRERFDTSVTVHGVHVTIHWETFEGDIVEVRVTEGLSAEIVSIIGDEVLLSIDDGDYFAYVNLITGFVDDFLASNFADWDSLREQGVTCRPYDAGWLNYHGVIISDNDGRFLYVYDKTNGNFTSFDSPRDPEGAIYRLWGVSADDGTRDRGFVVTISVPDSNRPGVEVLYRRCAYYFDGGKLTEANVNCPKGAVNYIRWGSYGSGGAEICVVWREKNGKITFVDTIATPYSDYIPDIYDYRYVDTALAGSGREIFVGCGSQGYWDLKLLDVDTGELRELTDRYCGAIKYYNDDETIAIYHGYDPDGRLDAFYFDFLTGNGAAVSDLVQDMLGEVDGEYEYSADFYYDGERLNLIISCWKGAPYDDQPPFASYLYRLSDGKITKTEEYAPYMW